VARVALEAAEDLELAVVRAVEAAELAEEPATDRALELERGVEAVRARVRAAVLDLEAGRVVDLAVERAAAVEQDPVEGLAVERAAAVEQDPVEGLAVERAAAVEQDPAAGLAVALAAAAEVPVSQENGRRRRRCSRAACWAECRGCRAEWRAARAAMR
jgi:hypothetical protein